MISTISTNNSVKDLSMRLDCDSHFVNGLAIEPKYKQAGKKVGKKYS